MKTIYVVLQSSAEADKGIFNAATAMGGYYSRQRAYEELLRFVSEEKEQMEIPFPFEDYREEFTPDHWEAWQDGYAAGWFIRYEIVPVECEAEP